MRSARRLVACCALAAGLAACDAQPIRREPVAVKPPSAPRVYYLPAQPALTPLPKVRKSSADGPPRPNEVPDHLELTPDPIPVAEPPSASGNSRTYEVFGKTYNVLASARGYSQRGKASWYGRKFHGQKTASGEPYNMFALTAAHRSLPIPTYVRVTNLENGRHCIVRVNDRGPFHSGRIIDLSYAAAVKLGMLDRGEAPVEVEAITPSVQETRLERRYLQVGAFADPINAVSLREDLREEGVDQVEIKSEGRADAALRHRVLVGPFADRESLESARELLTSQRYVVTAVAD